MTGTVQAVAAAAGNLSLLLGSAVGGTGGLQLVLQSCQDRQHEERAGSQNEDGNGLEGGGQQLRAEDGSRA